MSEGNFLLWLSGFTAVSGDGRSVSQQNFGSCKEVQVLYRAEKMQGLDKADFYRQLQVLYGSLIDGERNWLANMANLAGLLYDQMERINWAGFYLWNGEELVLGPFQGKPACVRIPKGKGVCGTALARGETLVVPDVHQFPGHIACDAASCSEIVIPFGCNGRTLGVLDIDSPVTERFTSEDTVGLNHLLQQLVSGSDWDTHPFGR